jgi:hypothetical protein
MRRRRVFFSSTLLVLASLVLLSGGTAFAAGERYIAEAEGAGYVIRAGGETVFGGGLTDSRVTDDPLARAQAIGIDIAEESHTSAEASESGESEEDEGCAADAAPEDLPLAIDALIDACSYSFAAITGDGPQTEAEADGGTLTVSGAMIAEPLIDEVLGPISESDLQEALDEIEEQVLSEVRAGLWEGCEETLGEIAGELYDGLDEFADGVREGSEELADILDGLPDDDPCVLLAEIIEDAPVIGDASALFDDIEDLIRALLVDLTLLEVVLGGSMTDISTDAESVFAEARAFGPSVTMPSLAEIGEAVEALVGETILDFLDDVFEPLTAAIEEGLVEPIGEESEEFGAFLGTVLDVLRLDILDDEDALFAVTVGDTAAWAELDRASGEVTADGEATIVTIEIAQVLADLFQQDETTFELGPGDSAVLFEDTPLESTIGVGAVRTADEEQDGLSGRSALAVGVEIRLFESEEAEEAGGPLEILVADSYAAAYTGEDEPAPQPAPLPVTGAGVGLAALMVVGALGLSRRRMML